MASNYKKKDKVYMAVTPDRFEFPIYITETAKELSELVGVSVNNIMIHISRDYSGKQIGYKFVRVIFDDKEEE